MYVREEKKDNFFLDGGNRKKSLKKPLLLLTKSPPQLLPPHGIKISSLTWTLKKLKYADEELLPDSFDDEYTFNTEESEGYRLIDVKNLSTTVSKAHMCEKGENFLL